MILSEPGANSKLAAMRVRKLLPVGSIVRPPSWSGPLWVPVSQNFLSHLPLMIYGAMIIGFLLFEPLGLAKIYDNIRKYFMVWPFRHARS